jgi:RNA polymerase sigma-70 factor, ECF subfamily
MHLDDWIAALARRVAADLSREPPPDILWQRFRDENDQYAAVVLIALHGRPVWNYCRSALADYHAAEELFQDTFRDLYRCRHRIRHHAAVRGWLLRTAENKVRDAWRRRGRRPPIAPLNPDADLAISPTEVGTDAEAARRQVYRLLEHLPRDQRRAIELVKLAGLSPAEATAELGVSEGTIWARVSRGLHRLRLIAGGSAAVGGPMLLDLAFEGSTTAVPVELIGTTVFAMTTRPPAVVAAGWMQSKILAAAVLAGGLVMVVSLTAASLRPTTPPAGANPPIVQTEREESLPERNRRLLERDVVPAVLRELASIPGGEDVRLVSCKAYDTRVEVAVEGNVVRVLSYDAAKPYRAKFLYDTSDGWKRLFIQFHADERWTMVNADRPMTVTGLPRVGEVEIGMPAVARAWQAFAAMRPDERTAGAVVDRDDSERPAILPWLGTWQVIGRPGIFRIIRHDRHYGLGISGPGFDKEHWVPFERAKVDGSGLLRTVQFMGKPLLLSSDALRLDCQGERWERAEVLAAGEALPPTPGRDLTGIYCMNGNPKVLCVALHRPNGRILLVNEGGGRTYGALNSKGEIHAADSGEWAPAIRGVMSDDRGQIVWTNPAAGQVRWVRQAEDSGAPNSIWYSGGLHDRTCALVETVRGGDQEVRLLIDAWDRAATVYGRKKRLELRNTNEFSLRWAEISPGGSSIEWVLGDRWQRLP